MRVMGNVGTFILMLRLLFSELFKPGLLKFSIHNPFLSEKFLYDPWGISIENRNMNQIFMDGHTDFYLGLIQIFNPINLICFYIEN